MQQTVLELDYRPSGGAVETVVVQADEYPCGAFVSGHFVPLLRTVEGWAFVHNLVVAYSVAPSLFGITMLTTGVRGVAVF